MQAMVICFFRSGISIRMVKDFYKQLIYFFYFSVVYIKEEFHDSVVSIKEELHDSVDVNMEPDMNSIIKENSVNGTLTVENQIIGTNNSMHELVIIKELLQDDLVSNL